MHYDLSFDNFTTIPLQSGTIQNINCRATVEVSTSDTENTGLVLYPGEMYEWNNSQIYARAKWSDGEAVRVAVESLVGGSGGGGGGSTIIVNNVEEWKPNYPYSKGILVIYNNTLYKAVKASNKATFDPDDWTMIGGSGGISEWAANTAYSVNTIVVYNGELYTCKTAHTSGNTFDATKWQKIGDSNAGTYLHDWKSGEYYEKDEIVSVDGVIYRSNTNHTAGTTFAGDATKWDEVSEYELPIATASDIGGVKSSIDKGKVSVDATGIMTYNAPISYADEWASSTEYAINDVVENDNKLYLCIAAHTSSAAFGDDLTANKWAKVGYDTSVVVAKDATAAAGYQASYTLTVNGTALTPKINIPKDYVLKSATVETVTVADQPYTGATVGDNYADFVVNTVADGDGTAETDLHRYMPLPKYTLPVASTTTLGGIKIGTGVEIDTDEKLNVVAATTTEIGGVKSSTSTGKVAVETDGTMTMNIGYRQPSTAYAVGDIAYHPDLPTGWRLECTTAGTTASGDLTISSPSIGGTVTDGTVTWTIGMPLSVNGGTMKASIFHTGPGSFMMYGGERGDSVSGSLQLGSTNEGGRFNLIAKSGSTISELTGYPNGSLTWAGANLGDAAIRPGAGPHNTVYRGKDLTSYFDGGTMSSAIAAGAFTGIYPGDYITKTVTIDGTTYTDMKWIVMDCDYFLYHGDTELTQHHVVMMAESAVMLGIAMNDSNTTEGGYIGSKMWTREIPKVVTGVQAAFGAAHVLQHQEVLSNAISTTSQSAAYGDWYGVASDYAWYDVLVNIPNEPMIYGCHPCSSSFNDIGDCTTQFSAFRTYPNLRCESRHGHWLRTVCAVNMFAVCARNGNAGYNGSGQSLAYNGIRPYFLLY